MGTHTKWGKPTPFSFGLLSNLKKIALSYKTADSKHSCALPSVESLVYNA